MLLRIRYPPDTDTEPHPHLALLYAKARQKVDAAAKRKKNLVVDSALLKKFDGGYPPSLLRVMSGECVAEGLGFHQLAMQIAITSNVLGKSEEAMLALCEGLIAGHVSDARFLLGTGPPEPKRVEESDLPPGGVGREMVDE